MGLTMQSWREIAIAISQKYLKKGFQRDEKDKKRVNEDEMKDMQVGHRSHMAGIIYVRGIREQNKAVTLI